MLSDVEERAVLKGKEKKKRRKGGDRGSNNRSLEKAGTKRAAGFNWGC